MKDENMTDLDRKRVDAIIRFALKEDIWSGDVTSGSVLDDDSTADAVMLARQQGIICGVDIAERVFSSVDEDLKFRPTVSDGDHIEPGQEIAFIEGNATSIMKGERTALNFMSMLSGVSTNTRRMVDILEGTGVKLYDTRKTIPLHRYLQKYAVSVGGGFNHRKGLWDMVLIKDNHIRIFAMDHPDIPPEAVAGEIVKRARANVQKNIRIEIEVESLKECRSALEERPDVIMLDNMPPAMITEAVEMRRASGREGQVLFEVSGGITPQNIRSYAIEGVDMISTGSVTGAVHPVNLSLEIILK
ncbi:MAG: carboxylating nicotinate-nucleotide diphosphorylase [Candidatus Omnitrophica bacterium]|nr:carboxylating nicotinate-nucleotide diphosphorylase [Candidatus Omnitrophota bacterium]